MCHNINHLNIKIKRFRLFQNIINIFIIIKSWDMWQHVTCSHCLTKSRILIASDNTYMTNQRMKAYFIDFLSSKFFCRLQLVSMQLVQHDY
jgi:hypothetical protein